MSYLKMIQRVNTEPHRTPLSAETLPPSSSWERDGDVREDDGQHEKPRRGRSGDETELCAGAIQHPFCEVSAAREPPRMRPAKTSSWPPNRNSPNMLPKTKCGSTLRHVQSYVFLLGWLSCCAARSLSLSQLCFAESLRRGLLSDRRVVSSFLPRITGSTS